VPSRRPGVSPATPCQGGTFQPCWICPLTRCGSPCGGWRDSTQAARQPAAVFGSGHPADLPRGERLLFVMVPAAVAHWPGTPAG
jgi:hypothetical protein